MNTRFASSARLTCRLALALFLHTGKAVRAARFFKGLRALRLFGTLASSSNRVKRVLSKVFICLMAVLPVVLVLFIMTTSAAYVGMESFQGRIRRFSGENKGMYPDAVLYGNGNASAWSSSSSSLVNETGSGPRPMAWSFPIDAEYYSLDHRCAFDTYLHSIMSLALVSFQAGWSNLLFTMRHEIPEEEVAARIGATVFLVGWHFISCVVLISLLIALVWEVFAFLQPERAVFEEDEEHDETKRGVDNKKLDERRLASGNGQGQEASERKALSKTIRTMRMEELLYMEILGEENVARHEREAIMPLARLFGVNELFAERLSQLGGKRTAAGYKEMTSDGDSGSDDGGGKGCPLNEDDPDDLAAPGSLHDYRLVVKILAARNIIQAERRVCCLRRPCHEAVPQDDAVKESEGSGEGEGEPPPPPAGSSFYKVSMRSRLRMASIQEMFSTELIRSSAVDSELETEEQGGVATEMMTTDKCFWDDTSKHSTQVFGNRSGGGLQGVRALDLVLQRSGAFGFLHAVGAVRINLKQELGDKVVSLPRWHKLLPLEAAFNDGE